MLTFLKFLCACGFKELVAWQLVEKMAVRADFWKGGGLGFDFGWRGLTS
jgi:hypothetical protein